MAEHDSSGKPNPSLPPTVRFFYVKSHAFRVLHVDGALGGLTPRGLIHCAIYNERPAIPQEQEIPIIDGLRLGDPVSQEGKVGIVREIEADLILSKQTAIELRDWLSRRLEDISQIEAESKQEDDNAGASAKS